MANKKVFNRVVAEAGRADTTNRAGGVAYAMSPKEALAQLACTGTFSDTYYADGTAQLDDVLAMASQVEPEYLAKVAVYARHSGYMKDMPAAMLAFLATRDPAVLERCFFEVLDTGKMLRNFVQMIRSGQFGRKSFGTRIKRLIQRWLTEQDPDWVFRNALGQQPSMGDIIKMVHPKPRSSAQRALFGYLIGKEHDASQLPESLIGLEAFRSGETNEPPRVPFQYLMALDLSELQWALVAANASWHVTRMNLNTFARHGVFQNAKLISIICDRLRNPELIRKARAFPYQLFMAWKAISANLDVPGAIGLALQDAMEVAIENVPAFDCKTVYVAVDTSSSMRSPVTGRRRGATSAVQCVDVAALIASAILRRNENVTILPFNTQLHDARLNPRDSVVSNTEKLAKLVGGGTACSVPAAGGRRHYFCD